MQIPNLVRIGSHVSTTLNNTTVFSPANVPGTATYIMVQSLAQNARYRLDGGAPTATLGFQLKTTDEPLLIPLAGDVNPRFIGEASGAILHYQFFGTR